MRKINIKPQVWAEEPQEQEISKEIQKIKVNTQAWEIISGLQPPNIIRVFEGVNQLNAYAIKESQATRNKNITTSQFPAISIRGGYSVLMNMDVRDDGVDGLAVYQGKELHVITSGTWQRFKDGVWSTLKTGLNIGEKWSFINFQGSFSTMHLIATNGIDPALKYDGTSVLNLVNAPTGADLIATHDNRVYIAVKSMVHFSALRKAEDWNTVDESGQIAVETTDGKDITGIVAGSARLTVFKENSIHELFGTNPGNFSMKTVTENLGSPTGSSAQVVGGIIYFLGNDGVYRYSGGSLPDKEFSLPVSEYVRSISKTYAKNTVSWNDGKRYYLGVCANNSISPNTILEFDTVYNTWNVWEISPTIAVNPVTWDGVVYAGNTLGNVIKFDSATDAGTPISWEWVSKPFSFQSLASKNRWFRLWIVADVPTGSSLNVYLSDKEEGESWSLVYGVTGTSEPKIKQQIHIPVDKVCFANVIRLRLEGTGPVKIHEITRQERTFPMGMV